MPGDSFEDLPPLLTVDERVQGQFIDCRAILGVTWNDYCARIFVRPGCLLSLVKFEEGPLRYVFFPLLELWICHGWYISFFEQNAIFVGCKKKNSG